MHSHSFFSLSSQDIDEIPAALPDWDIEWQQLSRGRFHGHLKSIQFDGLEILYLSWNQAIQIRGSSPPGTISLGIEISSQGRSFWKGLEYDERDVLINANREVNLKIPSGYELFSVTVDRDLLLEYADLQQRNLRQHDLNKSLGKPNLAALNAIKAYLHSSFALPDYHLADRLNEQQCLHASSATQDILSLLLTILQSTDTLSSQFQHLRQRTQLVKRLERYMLRHINQPLTIEHLCTIAGVSERSLNNYFHDVLDMSPMAYFKALRLNRVRAALKLADPSHAKVASIAEQHGFQHMGYFSVDYKSMFGESPSETLRKLI